MTSSHQLLPIMAELLGPGAQIMHSAWQRVQEILYSHHVANFVIGAYALFYFLPRLRPWIDCWKHLCAAIYIEESQEFYVTLLDWISDRLESSNTLKLLIKDKSNRKCIEQTFGERIDDTGGRFHTAHLQRSMDYQPWYGITWFWYEGTFIIVERLRNRSTSYIRHGDEETIALRTPGFSAQPIKNLLDSIAARANLHNQPTKIFSVRPKQTRNFGGPWSKISTQQIRPIQSVALDKNTKNKVLDEINEFLQPRHSLACAEKGIPWRRGYLFHGPPGTGKTSFVTAIAGIFGIPIYIVSIQDSDIEDADLPQILPRVPPRSVVLIEDIDTFDVTGNRKMSGPDQEKSQSGNISLSGLLNALDGITSPNGCILIMTTNFPEKLDEALTRPGRIDQKVYFPLITKKLAGQMFLHRYGGDGQSDVSLMAKQFKNSIPESTLSPALVQEILFAKRPEAALERANEYKDKKCVARI